MPQRLLIQQQEWTPIVGAVVAATELWIAISGTDHVRGTIMLATTGIIMTALRPGARLVDALLFGRKRLDILNAPAAECD